MKAALFCSLLFHISLVVWCSTESIIYNLQNVGCSFQDSLCLWRSKGATKNVRWKLSTHEENDIPYLNNGEQDFLFLYSENDTDETEILWSPKFFTRNDLIYLTLNVYCTQDLDSFIVFYRYDDDDKGFSFSERFDIDCKQKYSWNYGQKVTIETGVNNKTNHFRLIISGYDPPLAMSNIQLSGDEISYSSGTSKFTTAIPVKNYNKNEASDDEDSTSSFLTPTMTPTEEKMTINSTFIFPNDGDNLTDPTLFISTNENNTQRLMLTSITKVGEPTSTLAASTSADSVISTAEATVYDLEVVGCSFQDSLCSWYSRGATDHVRWKLSAHQESDIPPFKTGDQDFLFLYSENGSEGLDILWSPNFFTRNDLIYLTLNVYCAEDLDSFIVFYRYDDDKKLSLLEHFDIVCEQKYTWNNGQKVTIETGVNNETSHFSLTVSGYKPPLAISDIHLSEYIMSSSTLVTPTSGNNTSSQTTAGDSEVNSTNDNVYTENTTLTTQTEKYSTLNSTSNNTSTEAKILTSSSSKQTELNTWSSARTNTKDREISTTTAPTNLGNTSYSMSTIQTSDTTTNASLTSATNDITSNLSLTTSTDELITSKPTLSTATDEDNLLNSTFIITTDKGYTSGSMVTVTSAEHNTSKSIFTVSTNVYSTFNSTLATLVGENNTASTISTPNDDNMSNGTSSELTNNIFSSTSAITQPITPTLTITTDGEYKNDSTYTARTDDHITSTSTTIPTSTEHVISSVMSVTTSDDNKQTSPTTESIIEDSSSISTLETNTYSSSTLLHTTRSSTKVITQTRISSSVKMMSTSSETLSTKNSFISDMKESHAFSSVHQTIIGVFIISWLSVFLIFLVKAGKRIRKRREHWTVKESEIGDTVFNDVSSTPVVLRITSHNDG